MDLPRINPPELFTRAHKRVPSLSPTRSPTRQRITDDILSDLSPTTTLEAFTNPSGKLRASVEAATPSERAFGIRATLASKKIQEWVDELSAWPWPSGEGSAGFEIPAAKRRRISVDERTPRAGYQGSGSGEEEYIGSLPAEYVARYENRVDDIHEDMDDLDVEEIKSTVLNTHFSPKSRPSSSGSNAPVPSLFSSFTRMDDFTAVVTATVLQALPNLSRLTRLMDVWTVRLLVLRKVPSLLLALDDAEVALKSGWQAVELPRRSQNGTNGKAEDNVLERKTFEIMRDVLQDKVTTLGKDLDYMLDTLEGRQETLPEIWLDRMEAIERDYGEWVVRGDRKVREGEWAMMAKARKAEADRLRAEEEAREAARLQAENERIAQEQLLRLKEEEADRLERELEEAEAKLRLEEEAAVAEAARQAELAQKQEEDRIKDEEEAVQLERERLEREENLRLEREAAAEAIRHAELARKQEEDRIRAEEAAQLERQERLRSEQEVAAESARLAELELARKQEEDRLRAETEAARHEAEKLRIAHEERLRLEKETAAERVRQSDLARKQEEDALRLKERQLADAEAPRFQKEKALKEREAEQKLHQEEASKASKAAELARQQLIKDAEATRISGERKAPTLNPQANVVKAEMISPTTASAFVLGIGAAVTPALLPSGHGEAAEPESPDLPREDSPASQSISTYNDGSATPSGPANLTKERNLSKDLHTIASLAPSSPVAKFAPFDGSDDGKKEDSASLNAHPITADNHQNSPIASITPSQKSPTSLRPETPTTGSYSEKPSSPGTPSTPSGPLTPVALTSPSARSADGGFYNEKSSPSSPSRIARFGHGVANMLRRTSSPKASSEVRSQSSGSQPHSPTLALPIESPRTPTKAAMPESVSSTPAQSSITSDTPPLPLRSPARERIDQQWIVVEPVDEDDAQSPEAPPESTDSSDVDNLKVHSRNISLVSGYSTSDPTPDILEAEPAEYFRPMLSPIKSTRSHARSGQPALPSKSPLNFSGDGNMEESLLMRDSPEPTPISSTKLDMEEVTDNSMNSQTLGQSLLRRAGSDVGGDGTQESVQSSSEELELEYIIPPVLARKTSIARINCPIRQIDIPRRESTASDTSTLMNRQPVDAASSPLSPSTPLSERGALDTFPNVEDESPSKGRVRSRIEQPADRSPSASPPPIPAMSPRRSFHHPKSPSFSKTKSESPDVPSTPSEAPVFDNIDLSEASTWSSPKKTTDDQIQAQISSLLESIPARIRLTSEPDSTTFVPSDTLRPPKARRSITPSFRSYSSLSMRAPTPSFTLAPAYGKGTSRPRPQNGNPEIKLYHLSRSTGEAPIKLFVRLVGENGERVMVRVGGGWADLGEYLKEYASHHGRRSAVDSDKVEVQDIRPRVVSTSSTASTTTVRGNNGRSSPVSRPASAFDRPMSSLHIRKTRRSVGETDSSANSFRNPSTPLPMSSRGRDFETPPSETSRSTSRLSWTEEERGLGLAGPKAKKVAISEKDQEWVESMKEKVRLASAEKEKKEKAKERKSFGEMDRVGGTKRLFRKG